MHSYTLAIKSLDAGIAAIDSDDLASDIAGFFGTEENSSRIQFAWVTISLHWNRLVSEGLEEFRVKSLLS
jgi:hypothetical protein